MSLAHLYGTRVGPVTNIPALAMPTITWIDMVTTSGLNETTHSFGNFTVGSAGTIIAFYMCRPTNNVDTASISIGGVTATIVYDMQEASATFTGAIATRAVAAGSHNISATLTGASGALNEASMSAWLWTLGNNNAIPTDTFTGEDAGNTTWAQPFQFPRYSKLLGVVYRGNTDDATVSGGATEREDTVTGTRRYTALDYENNTATDVIATPTITWSSSVSTLYMTAVWI